VYGFLVELRLLGLSPKSGDILFLVFVVNCGLQLLSQPTFLFACLIRTYRLRSLFVFILSCLLLLLLERQHYRLYAIHHIPTLKTLDFLKVTRSERDRAERLANSAAGAALESDAQMEAKNAATKTFVPGEGESAEEAFVTNFTPEQKETIRQMVANAKSPAEIDEIERSVRRGVFPNLPTVTPLHAALGAASGEGELVDSRKRPAEEPVENGGTNAKKGRLKEG
jgi:hypothetical protein